MTLRVSLSVLTLSLCAPLAISGGCTEHFPRELAERTSIDAGVDADGPLETDPPKMISYDDRRDATSSPVVFNPVRGGVWTANHDVGSVSYADVDANKLAAEVGVGTDVRSVALSPDFKWIAAVDRGAGQVAFIDPDARRVARQLPVGGHPRAAIWDAMNPRWLYVSVEDDDAVAIVDRMKPEVVARVAVGRLPAGLAVSRRRQEVVVLHRIDAKVSLLDIASRKVIADVAISDEPASMDPKVPHGRPFAFESLAWAPDGRTAWVPHMLLAATRPITFDETLFPAVSVVDVGDARKEVATDLQDPLGAIAGRKNLFDAINVIDSRGNATVVSQPCAAALHPNGLIGYVLACASEDLIVFDTARGVATDVVQGALGDHPVGLALDDTGQRLFALAEQGHVLSTFDIAIGNPTKRPRRLGDVTLVERDPIEGDLREGYKLFYRANSSKGPLAMTGRSWMSCGGCHLDGLVSTNLVFFDALVPKDPALDARIGHIDLRDLFATVPDVGTARFDPHDILVAIRDQGGLAPDRTGADRAGAVDPAAPSEEARALASRVARVIARDLPIGPSWLIAREPKPNLDNDGAFCGKCHTREYEAWRRSAHAHSAEDPMFRYGVTIEQKARGNAYPRLCAGCHDPVSARGGDTSFAAKRGVTCLGCHDTERLIRAGGNADLEARGHDYTSAEHHAWGRASLPRLRSSEFCGGCHEQFVPGTGVSAITTLTEHNAAAGQMTCVDCHMPTTNGAADHMAVGGNVYLASAFGDAELAAEQKAKLATVLSLVAVRQGDHVNVTLENKGASHGFPTGVTDIREPWVEVQAVDAARAVLARYGGPESSGLISPAAARLGIDIARPDGALLLAHELSETSRIPYDVRVMPGKSVSFAIPLPSTLPGATTELQAVVFYRNVRTPYFRLATGDAGAIAPEVEVVRRSVQ